MRVYIELSYRKKRKIMSNKEKEVLIEHIWKYIRDAGDKYKCVLECMVSNMDHQGIVIMGSRDISKIVKIPYSTIHLFLQRLQDEGFFERIGKGVYRLIPDEL